MINNIEDAITTHLSNSEEMVPEDTIGSTDGSIDSLMGTLLNITSHLRVFHWMSSVHAEHVILGDLYDALDDLTDKIIENVMSNRNIASTRSTPKMKKVVSIEVRPYSGLETSVNYLDSARKIIRSCNQLDQTTELSGLRDEILEVMGSSIYLLGIVFNDKCNPDQEPLEETEPTDEYEEFSEEDFEMVEPVGIDTFPAMKEQGSECSSDELKKNLGVILINDFEPSSDSTNDSSVID